MMMDQIYNCDHVANEEGEVDLKCIAPVTSDTSICLWSMFQKHRVSMDE